MHTPAFAAPKTLEGEFAQMVRRGLSLPRKQLQPAFFYDSLGSALFEAITHLPEYTITRAETSLLDENVTAILAAANEPVELIELGPGNGKKLAILARRTRGAQICLIDISESALSTASHEVEQSCGTRPATILSTFVDGLRRLPPRVGNRLVLFLGSNIGNFSNLDAVGLLRGIRQFLVQGDSLLLGADLVKEVAQLVAAYDDDLGVTATFNKNILLRMNRDLDANFDLGAFEHRAIWVPESNRIELHLESTSAQDIRIPHDDFTASFRTGETIRTECCHKYHEDALRKLIKRAGFHPSAIWVHSHFRFANILCTVP
jgi:L-histidine N-alpha-methyltransferase